jgi:hypothetical protein
VDHDGRVVDAVVVTEGRPHHQDRQQIDRAGDDLVEGLGDPVEQRVLQTTSSSE